MCSSLGSLTLGILGNLKLPRYDAKTFLGAKGYRPIITGSVNILSSQYRLILPATQVLTLGNGTNVRLGR